MKNCKINKIVGIVTICINVLLLFNAICMYYFWNFIPMLLMYIPNSTFLISALLGIAGIFMSIMLYKKVIGIRLFLIITLVLWLIIGYNTPPFVGFSLLGREVTAVFQM